MSSNGRLLKKLRKVMGVAVASSNLIACSSQIDACNCTSGCSLSCKCICHKMDEEHIPSATVHITVEDGVMRITGSGEVTQYDVEPYEPNKNNVHQVIIGDGISTIGDNVFLGFEKIEKIILPSSIKEIKEFAFYACFSLKEIAIPEGIVEIGQGAFAGCSALESFTFPSTVKKIGKAAFRDCDSLQSINIPEGVTTMGEEVFEGCEKLEKVIIPSSVEKVGDKAFALCENLKEIKISEGVTTIGRKAFADCYNLENITIPASMRKIEDLAFFACDNLREVKFVPTIDVNDTDLAMLWALKLRGICQKTCLSKIIKCRKPLPTAKLLFIGDMAFLRCPELRQIELPQYVQYMPNAFGFNTKVTVKKMEPCWW